MELYNKLLKRGESNCWGTSAFMLMFYGGLIAPATVFAIETGNQTPIHFLLAILSGINMMALNIAVQPMRFILPFFLGTVALHLIIILINIV